MYHLALSLYQHYMSREEYSLLLLGLDNAGKTTLLSAIKSLYPPSGSSAAPPDIAPNTVPTVGQTVATIELADMYLKIWDVGGQHSLRRLWKSYYKSCHAIVFVVDSSDLGDDGAGWEDVAARQMQRHDDADRQSQPEQNGRSSAEGRGVEAGRLEECRLVLENILTSADTAGVPILVLANKQDREDCVETVKIKEGLVRPVFEGEKGGAVRDSRVLPISALKGTGVKEAVEWVRSRVKWNREARPPLMR